MYLLLYADRKVQAELTPRYCYRSSDRSRAGPQPEYPHKAHTEASICILVNVFLRSDTIGAGAVLLNFESLLAFVLP